jgi:phosphoribosylformylglycinamidine (FGAM) synthase-like enzyme
VPPRVDLAAERALADVLAAASSASEVASAHDLSEGGLAQALAESCLRHDVGVTVTPAADLDAFVWLFSESAARAVVAVRAGSETAFVARCADAGVPAARIGHTTGSADLTVEGEFSIPLAELRAAWSETLPAAFGHS